MSGAVKTIHDPAGIFDKDKPEKAASPEEQARANRISTFGPTGSSVFYNPGEKVPGQKGLATKATQVTALSPEQQAIYNLLMQGTTALGERGVKQIGALPGVNQPVLPVSSDATRQRVEQAQFDRAMSLLNPQIAQQEEALRQRLANQGLPQASRAATAELGTFGDVTSRAREDAALAAILAGGQESDRVNSQALTARNTQMNEILTMLGLQQVQMPQPVTPGMVQFQTPVQPPNRGMAVLGGAASGATAGAPAGPYGAAVGAGVGGLLGLMSTR